MSGSDLDRRQRIDVRPHFTESDCVRLNNMFRGRSTEEMMESVLRDSLAGELAIVSSFGTESAVLLHIIAEIDRSVPVLFLETHKHFPETISYRDQLAEFLRLDNLVILEPDTEELAARDKDGTRWQFDPDGCCEMRKVRPLAKALAGYSASVTGRKGFQSSTRSGLPRFEIDTSDALGRFKINPLASWDKPQIEAYFAEHNLPRHPLEAQGYPSIGCAPCTAKVAPGEDPRSGRWKGFDKTECGIHQSVDKPDK